MIINGDIKYKILEVLAIAEIIAIEYGHTKKFGKHYVALVIKQLNGEISDRELAEFLMNDEIGRILGYKQEFSFTIFSKLRKESTIKEAMEKILNIIINSKIKNKQVRLVVIDSTDISAYSSNDKDAKYGHRTPSKKEQRTLKKGTKTMFFGYKLHLMADAKSEIPLSEEVIAANRHDKTVFHKLYNKVKEFVYINPFIKPKLLADSAYDATDIYEELHYDGMEPLIAMNGRRFYKSTKPKDPEYGKRWAIERIFSRLKEKFGFRKNRLIGYTKVAAHAIACIIAYIIYYI
jgi:transposase